MCCLSHSWERFWVFAGKHTHIFSWDVCLGCLSPRGTPRPRTELCNTGCGIYLIMCVIEKGAAAVKKHVEDDNDDKNLVKAIMRHMSWEFTPLFVLCVCVCMLKECTYIFWYRGIHICGCIRKILANGSDACGFICRLGKQLRTCRVHTHKRPHTDKGTVTICIFVCVRQYFVFSHYVI